MVSSLFGLFLIYAASPLITFGILDRCIQFEKKENRSLILLCCLGWGPALLSLVNSWLMLTIPGREIDFYRVLIVVVILGLLLFLRKRLKIIFQDLISLIDSIIKPLFQSDFLSRILLVSFIGLMLFFVIATQYSPVVGNDALEYRKVSGYLTETRNFWNYPVNDTEASSGLFAPWSHPPGFVGLAVVGNIIVKGALIWDFGFKLINPLYVFFTILLMMGVFRFIFKKPPHLGIIAGILLLSTPVFAWQAFLVHVDSFRLFFSLTTAVMLLFLLSSDKRHSYIILTGLSAGLGVFAHSLGLLTLPMVCLSYLLLASESLKSRIVSTSLIMLVAFSVVFKTIITNVFINGVFASDLSSIKVVGMEKLAYSEYLEISRGLGSIFYLVLNGFVAESSFGYSYWLFLFSVFVVFYLKMTKKFSKQAKQMYSISLIFIATFYGILIGTLLLGSHALAKNNRYYLCAHVFVSFLSAFGIWELLVRILNKEDSYREIDS